MTIEAADLLENFSSYWEACTTVENPEEARKQLLAKIVDRVFIYEDKVIAIALHGDYAVVLDHGGVAPDEIVEKLKSETAGGTSDETCTSCAQSGSDGIRSRTYKKLVVIFLPKHVAYSHLSQVASDTDIISQKPYTVRPLVSSLF